MDFLLKIFGKAKNPEVSKRCKCDESFNSLKKESSIEDVNYGLGFNDVDFSDRVLRLEIAESRFLYQVKTLNVCSLMLAAKSPFFYKLFKNGMKESKMSEFTIKINASEKAAFLDMLNWMYYIPLTASFQDELVDLMMAADKFEVTSCVRHCVKMLLEFPMTIESALLYLGLPSTLFVGEITRPIIDAAKPHLCSHFSGFTESQQDEAMSLPLCGIEAVVGGIDFQVTSEVVVLDFMLKWARKNYPDLKERCDILTNRLIGLICLSCLSNSKLKEIVNCPDFGSTQVRKLAFKALSYKIKLPQGTNSIPTIKEASRLEIICCRVVFFDIRKEDCVALAASSRIYTGPFDLGGRRFSLFAQRYQKEGSSIESLGLFVEMGSSGSCTLKYEFSAMTKPSYEFESLFSGKPHTFTETDKSWGCSNLLKMPWEELMEDDDDNYIIDWVIRIRAKLTM